MGTSLDDRLVGALLDEQVPLAQAEHLRQPIAITIARVGQVVGEDPITRALDDQVGLIGVLDQFQPTFARFTVAVIVDTVSADLLAAWVDVRIMVVTVVSSAPG